MQTKNTSLDILTMVGESFSGKSTLSNFLINTFPDHFQQVISVTSREKRTGEKEGVDYKFRDNDFFQDVDKFVELNHVKSSDGSSAYYGALKSDFVDASKNNKIAVLIREPEGAKFFQELYTIESEEHIVSIRENNLMILDFTKATVLDFLQNQLKMGNIGKEEYKDAMKRLGRFDTYKTVRDMGLIQEASIVREDYYPLDYVLDIAEIMPEGSGVRKEMISHSLEKAREELFIYSAYIDLKLVDFFGEMSLDDLMEAQDSKDPIMESLSKKYGVEKNLLAPVLFEFVREREEFPYEWRNSRGHKIAQCRILDAEETLENIEIWIKENSKRLYSKKEFNASFPIHIETSNHTYAVLTVDDLYVKNQKLSLGALGASPELEYDFELTTDTHAKVKENNSPKQANLKKRQANNTKKGLEKY